MSDSSHEKHVILVVPKEFQGSEYKVLTLPHCSKHNESTLCLLHKGSFLELQTLALSKQRGSFLIHNRVSSSNHVFVGSKFDPRFSLLSHFYASRERYSPLAQILLPMTEVKHTTEGSTELFNDVTNNPQKYKLHEICDVNDKHGDMVFYRYNEERVLAWLRNKVERVAHVIWKQRSKKDKPNGIMVATFVENGNVPDTCSDDKVTIKSEVNQEDLKTAVEIVCDCLNDMHTDLVLKCFGFSASDVLKKTAPVKRKQDWEIEVEQEKEAAVLSGFNSAKPNPAPSSTTGKQQPTKILKTTASKNEQANKAASKGTPAIFSFFGKK